MASIFSGAKEKSTRSSKSEDQDWVKTITDDLKQIAAQTRPHPENVMYRVRRQLRDLKPEHYAVEEFSFGLFDRPPKGARKVRAHKCKLLMANAVLKVMGMTADRWQELCQMVVPDPKKTQDMYDELGRDPLSPPEVQSVLTLDAVFLAGYLGSAYCKSFNNTMNGYLNSAIDPMTRQTIRIVVVKDLFKVENQIPLSLIHNVLLKLLERGGVQPADRLIKEADDALEAICLNAMDFMKYYLPGSDSGDCHVSPARRIRFVHFDNFLDCLYSLEMCEGLETTFARGDGEMMGTTDQKYNLPSVTELQKAGIEFRGRKGKFHNVEFKGGWFMGILYLPKLTLNDYNEVLWRNLVAYEEVQPYDRRNFTLYLHLMDMLIDTQQDVILLKSGKFPVIDYDHLGDTQAGAKLFNNAVLQNCYIAKNEKWRLIHKQVYEFYSQGQRRMLLEFVETQFGKPWLTASVMAAVVLLVMTLLQTWYSYLQYEQGEKQRLNYY